MTFTCRYPGKDGLKMLIHMIFKVGRALQPSVYHIDNCELMFKKKVPKTDPVSEWRASMITYFSGMKLL